VNRTVTRATGHSTAALGKAPYGVGVIDQLLPRLRTPAAHAAGLHLLATAPQERNGAGLQTATLVGPSGQDPSQIRNGIWEALGEHRPQRSAAQFSNALPLSPLVYESTWRGGAMSRFSGRRFPLSEEMDELFTAVGDLDGAFVVDVGCSEGYYARHCAQRGASVLALDHSRAFCRKAAKRASRLGVRVALARAIAQNLPVADDAADAVVMGGTFNEIGDRVAAFSEIGRVLRPGGRGYVVSLRQASSTPGRVLQRTLNLTGIEFPTVEQTNELFANAGLTITDQRVEGITVRTSFTR
jgi:SAM-dependent methyltransferase